MQVGNIAVMQQIKFISRIRMCIFMNFSEVIIVWTVLIHFLTFPRFLLCLLFFFSFFSSVLVTVKLWLYSALHLWVYERCVVILYAVVVRLVDIVGKLGESREMGAGYIVWQEVFDNNVKVVCCHLSVPSFVSLCHLYDVWHSWFWLSPADN